MCFKKVQVGLIIKKPTISHSPQIAVKLLIHKIHSPQEWEALQGLTVRHASLLIR